MSNVKTGGTHTRNQMSDYCYPSLPKKMMIAKFGKSMTLLAKTDKLRNIVGWAENNLVYHGPRFMSVGSDKLDTECFVVLYDIGSGAYVWMYMVYVLEGKPDALEWHLLCYGPVGMTKGRFTIDTLYLDSGKGTLVFATRDGRTIRSVRITDPLASLRKQLGQRDTR